MFSWNFAPMPFASSAFRARAAGSSSLKSFLMSTGTGQASREPRSQSCLRVLVKRRHRFASLFAAGAVSTRRLCAVEALVRQANQPLGVSLGGLELRDGRIAEADRDLVIGALRDDLELLDGGAEALGEPAGTVM